MAAQPPFWLTEQKFTLNLILYTFVFLTRFHNSNKRQYVPRSRPKKLRFSKICWTIQSGKTTYMLVLNIKYIEHSFRSLYCLPRTQQRRKKKKDAVRRLYTLQYRALRNAKLIQNTAYCGYFLVLGVFLTLLSEGYNSCTIFIAGNSIKILG